jgi:hypothetical protein
MRPGRARGVSAARAREIALSLPDVEAGRSYGFPSFLVRGQFLARLRDRDTVFVVHLRSFDDRDYLFGADPETFFTSDHYRDHPSVLVRLSRVKEAELRQILEDALARVPAKAKKPRR